MRLIEVTYIPLADAPEAPTEECSIAPLHVSSFVPARGLNKKYWWINMDSGQSLFVTKAEMIRVAQLVRET